MTRRIITKQKTVILFSMYIVVLTGCFSSTRVYKNEYKKNDSTFVQREVGAEVFIIMNNNDQYTGGLLTVNDCTMILKNEYGLSEEALLNSASNIYVIHNQDINSIWILGEDNHLIGIAIGIPIGAAIGYAGGDDPPGWFSMTAGQKACALGILGGVVGFIAGAASSTYDEEIYNYKNTEECDFTKLNIYSRYGGEEPDYLKEIK